MQRQRLAGAVARHIDTAAEKLEQPAAYVIRIRQQRITRELVRIGGRARREARPEDWHERAVAAPVEARDAAAESRRDIEA